MYKVQYKVEKVLIWLDKGFNSFAWLVLPRLEWPVKEAFWAKTNVSFFSNQENIFWNKLYFLSWELSFNDSQQPWKEICKLLLFWLKLVSKSQQQVFQRLHVIFHTNICISESGKTSVARLRELNCPCIWGIYHFHNCFPQPWSKFPQNEVNFPNLATLNTGKDQTYQWYDNF